MRNYEKVISSNPKSSRAHFGKARVFQLRAEFENLNDGQAINNLLELAIYEYTIVVENNNTPAELFRFDFNETNHKLKKIYILFRIAAQHLIECAKFRGGKFHKIISTQRLLIDKFPEDLSYRLDFGTFCQCFHLFIYY